MSRFTRKMLLLGLVGGLLPLAVASMVHAGATGCAFCNMAAFDFNGDGKSDGAWEKPTTSVLVRVTAMDNLSTPLATSFPLDTAGSTIEVNGAGHVSGAVIQGQEQAWLVTRLTSGPNVGLVRSVKINAGTLAADGSAFPLLAPVGFSLAGLGDANLDGTWDFYFVKHSAPNKGLVRIFLIGNDGELLGEDAGLNFAGTLVNNFETLDVGDMTGDGIADILAWNSSTGLYAVIKMGSIGCVAPTTVCFQSTAFPGTAGADYTYVGIAYNNLDDRMDILSVKTGGPNLGLLRVDRMGEFGDPLVHPPVFPVTVVAPFTIDGWGNYDGLNQADLKAINTATGVERVWNFDAAGDLATTSGFPIFNLLSNSGVFTAPWGSSTTAVLP